MQELRKKHAAKVRFGIIGAINTALDVGILFIISSLGVPKELSNICSTSVAFAFSFLANKKYTFRSVGGNDLMREIVLFTIVTLFGLWVIQGVVIWVLDPVFIGFDFSKEIALLASKLVATVATLVWNYVLYSRIVFVDSKKK